MFWTAGPALGISLGLFLLLGLRAEPSGAIGTEAAQEVLGSEYSITVVNLLPLLLLVVFALRKVPPSSPSSDPRCSRESWRPSRKPPP
jgi:Na+/H+ antiporter NhaC